MTTTEARTLITGITSALTTLEGLKQTEVDPYVAQALQTASDGLADVVAFWQAT